MSWLLRPWMLLVLSVALAASAAVVVLVPYWDEGAAGRPVPLPVGDDEREVVWLYPANNAAPWERLVTAVGEAVKRLRDSGFPDLEAQIDDATFPRQTAATPQFTIRRTGTNERLVVRWYKLTGTGTAARWIDALLARRPAPLAVIGGNSSDAATDLATNLRDQSRLRPDAVPPLLLLTAATADLVTDPDNPAGRPLSGIHAGHTFRFCFTDRQMAETVTGFIYHRDELRPDAEPVYVAQWRDDAYSLDLTEHFSDALQNAHAARFAGRAWAAGASAVLAGWMPLDLRDLATDRFEDVVSGYIDFSVGLYDQPNRWEEREASFLIDRKLARHAGQTRPLLVLPAGSSQPARRFLRALVRAAPAEAQRFVVATGDTVSFSTVYRDRDLAWPVQDLPLDLVFFCHRNPVDEEAGFRAEGERRPEDEGVDRSPNRGSAGTGTEDLLLDVDIVETLVLAGLADAGMPANGDDLAARFRAIRWRQGRVTLDQEARPMFDDQGNRFPSTGEHVVWLHPTIEGGRVQPTAHLSVWRLRKDWRLVRDLTVDYESGRADR